MESKTKQIIFVNGQKYNVSKSINILNLLKYLKYDPYLLVVEYNKIICTSDQWDKIYLTTNDRIEIVTIVGGG